MQIKKAGVVAAGAIATVAAMGAPAAAAPNADVAALTRASMLNMARNMDDQPQALAAVGTGSAITAAAWQVCGSAAVAGVGGTIDLDPDTVFGGCNNSNVKLKQDTVVPAIGALNDTAILAAPWQACASTIMGGVGGTIDVMAAKTVFGGCRNANVVITGPEDGYMTESAMVGEGHAVDRAAGVQQVRAAWAARKDAAKPAAAPRHVEGPRGSMGGEEPQALVSVGSGSAIIGAPWQACGGTAVWGVGGVVTVQSPHTMWSDCDNANIKITQDDPTAAVSVLDNAGVTAAAWQVCAADTVAGVGGTVVVGSENLHFGSCNNSNIVVD